MRKTKQCFSRLLVLVKYILITFLFCISTAIFMVCCWAKETFNVSINAIINTLTSPLKGTSSDTVIPALKYCLPAVILVFAICIIYIILQQKYRFKRIPIIVAISSVVVFLCSLAYVQSVYDVIGFLKYKNQETTLYEDYYINPRTVSIKEPDEKRNLLYIYLESMETTYADIDSGGKQQINYMPNSTELAKNNISFSNTELLGGLYPIIGANWTMGALFTSSSGLPFAFPVGTSDMEGEEVFASGVYTLGDYLEEQGYTQEFLCGSDAVFAGRRTFYEQHGGYEIFDLYTARERGYISEDYFEWWGFEDKILYEIAKDELLRLSEGKKPFNLTMLTVDAHHIGGYICNLCNNDYEDITANVIACADRQLSEFIKWCQQQDFYENTTIVIVGDHPRMDNHLVENVEYDERTLYNCFINAACQEDVANQNREASLLDMYPSVLAALGYEIEGDMLGLGTNLFSKEPTLLEKFGLEEVNNEFNKRSSYYVENFAPELFYMVSDEENAICTIYFGGDEYNATDYVKDGLSQKEGIFSWIEGKEMNISIPINEDVEKVHITIHVLGTVRDEYYGILQDGEKICDGVVKKACIIDFDAKVRNGTCDFTVKIPLVESPYAYGMGDDTRAISLKLTHLTVNLCEE